GAPAILTSAFLFLHPESGFNKSTLPPTESNIDHSGCQKPDRLNWKTSPSEKVTTPSTAQLIDRTARSESEPTSRMLTLGRRNPKRLKVHSLSFDFPAASEPQLFAHVRVATISPSATNRDVSLPDCSHFIDLDFASSRLFTQ